MDDCVLIHQDKAYLRQCLSQMTCLLRDKLQLEFNEKTKISPLKNGINYLGWHFYLTDTGKIFRKVSRQTKYKYKRKLKYFEKAYAEHNIELETITQTLSSYRAHLSHGHTYRLQHKIMSEFVLQRKENNNRQRAY